MRYEWVICSLSKLISLEIVFESNLNAQNLAVCTGEMAVCANCPLDSNLYRFCLEYFHKRLLSISHMNWSVPSVLILSRWCTTNFCHPTSLKPQSIFFFLPHLLCQTQPSHSQITVYFPLSILSYFPVPSLLDDFVQPWTGFLTVSTFPFNPPLPRENKIPKEAIAFFVCM